MLFNEAMEELKAGREVYRKKWFERRIKLDEDNKQLYISGNQSSRFIFDKEDFFAEDWEIYHECMSLSEAIENFCDDNVSKIVYVDKDGKKVYLASKDYEGNIDIYKDVIPMFILCEKRFYLE